MKAKKALLAIAAIIIALPIAEIVLASIFGLSLLGIWQASTGYTSAFQGLDAEFAALYYQGGWWSAGEKPYGNWQPSACTFGGNLLFDPDQAQDGWCDLGATQRAITLTQAKIEPYEWEVQVDSYTKYKFRMEKVELSWQINIFLDGSEAETCDVGPLNIVTWEPNYAGTQIWIRLKPNNFRYFQDNPDEFYIAPAYVWLDSDAKVYAKNQDGQMIANEPRMSVQSISPNAKGEAFYIYYARGGTPVDLQQTILSYRGRALDPSVFRSEYWIKIDLVNFKPVNWFELQMWHKWQYPSVQLDIKMYAFVVGKWVVKLSEGDIPTLSPHQTGGEASSLFDPLVKWWSGVVQWFSNPLNLLQVWLLASVVLIIVLAIFAPAALNAIFKGAGKAAKALGSRLKRKRRRR